MKWSVLAIDQSMTASGWAHLQHGQKVPTWGLRTCAAWGDDEGRHLWEFLEWLGEKMTALQVTHLFLENTFIPNHNEGLTMKIAQYGLIGMASTAAFLCGRRGQPVEFAVVTPGQWRATFLGSSEPPKGLVKGQRRTWLKDKAVRACLERGWNVEDNNVADALGILAFGCSAIDPAFATTQGPLFRRAELTFDNEQRGLR